MKYTYITLVFALSIISCQAQKIEADKIKEHIRTLASDEYEGRNTGSEGEKKANAYIEKQFKAIQLLPKGEKGYDQPFAFKSGVHGTGTEGTAENIIGYIDNGAENTIIIGAHYDHLGLGNDGSSLDANPKGKIHNGADDNASGTAGVIELARYFQKNGKKEKNNFLFICFSGEELGLYGSKYFTEHPTIDLSKVTYMINMDMIGRLPESKNLSVSGVGTSPSWSTVLDKLSNDQLIVKTDSSGMGPSDHSSFYVKNIPALHFFTGSHNDYHKPSDDWDKINYKGEVEVLNAIVKLVNELDTQPKLAFLTTKNKSMGGSRSFKVTLGVMPSYTSDVEGLLIDGVSDGKPAQKAGLLAGDIVVQIGEHEIKDIQNYMEALGKFEKGQTVPVKVKRKNEVLTYSVTF
ncbi:MAG: peptidase M28 [Azospira oryzae]|nr:MAG: peptidase M28 [Azospira oryzae]